MFLMFFAICVFVDKDGLDKEGFLQDVEEPRIWR